MKALHIAILGSGSHIAKGLINNFLNAGGFVLNLYTRSPRKVRQFLGSLGRTENPDSVVCEGYAGFKEQAYDVIINCVGVGTQNKLCGEYTKWFTVTEEYDNLVIDYLSYHCPHALYISFSSGAVYGRECVAPAVENTRNNIPVNHVASQDYYAIARLHAEAKHRAFRDLNIVDLRVFSYFSRFIDLMDGYFMAEIIDCIQNKKVFKSDAMNMVRDYVHPHDLFSLIKKCMAAGKINDAFDVMSSQPIEKKGVLDYFSSEYGLQYDLKEGLRGESATGRKEVYCSDYNKASVIGYIPKFSSLDCIKEETKGILSVSR